MVVELDEYAGGSSVIHTEQLPQSLDLPEHDFTYLAGSTDRPWSHFTGRWEAIKPHLARMLAAEGRHRIVDLGSCTGFFSLQLANQHPNVDVIGIEGSVGIGNGSVGMDGSPLQILFTPAVQTHLKWIQKLKLKNCYVAPEVWDYYTILELAKVKRPVCEVMILLSVIHHIDNVSVDQYTAQGMSEVEGCIDLIANLLRLAPKHVIELPNKPWLQAAFDRYHTARRILEAAAQASRYEWSFTGPVHRTEWFGQREVWILEEANGTMPQPDMSPRVFPEVFNGSEPELQPACAPEPPGAFPSAFPSALPIDARGARERDWALLDPLASSLGASRHDLSMNPALTAAVDPAVVPDGEALAQAPTALLLAHLALREAIMEAQELLRERDLPVA